MPQGEVAHAVGQTRNVAAPVKIRRARAGDMAALAQLCVEHARFEGVPALPTPDPGALARAILGKGAPLQCWVVQSGATLLGYASATRDFST